MDEHLRWLFDRLRPRRLDRRPIDLRRHDRLADVLEREQRELEARLRLLEIQSDLRGEPRRDGD